MGVGGSNPVTMLLFLLELSRSMFHPFVLVAITKQLYLLGREREQARASKRQNSTQDTESEAFGSSKFKQTFGMKKNPYLFHN